MQKLSSQYQPCSQNRSTATRTRHCKTGDLHARKLYNCNLKRENYLLGARDRFAEFTNKCNYRGSAPSIYLLLFFITNTKEFASFCLCVLYSGRSTVHAETPSSRICDKRFFHCGPYVRGLKCTVAIGEKCFLHHCTTAQAGNTTKLAYYKRIIMHKHQNNLTLSSYLPAQ